MSTKSFGADEPRQATAAADGRLRRRFAALAAAAAVYTYLLIVFGGIVRITGSGMGCGEDWPKCNGQWIPEFDFATLIEYGHRLLALGLILVITAVVVMAIRQRARPGFGGRGGATRPAVALVGLIVLQSLLGAITVKLELSATMTVLHFVTASLILACLMVAALRAWPATGGAAARRAVPGAGPATGAGPESTVPPTPLSAPADADPGPSMPLAALAAAALGLVVVAFGALTANTGAAPLCQGFPLCNGQWVPQGGPYVHIHWTHRLVAFLLFFHVAGAAYTLHRRSAPARVRRAANLALGLIVLQLAIAAALVSLTLPPSLQAAHLAIGTAVWAALVLWTFVAFRPGGVRSPPKPQGVLDPA